MPCDIDFVLGINDPLHLYTLILWIIILQSDWFPWHYFLQSCNVGSLIILLPTQSIYHRFIKGDLRTICRFSYMKVYKLITLGTKFKTLLSLGRKITMFSKFITNYIEQGWWHSSLTLKCMHLLLKEVNKRGRHAYNLHGWTCLPSGIVMEIHCHITGVVQCNLFMIFQSTVIRVCYQNKFPNFECNMIDLCTT